MPALAITTRITTNNYSRQANMGWRGTLRSLEAAARASAREAERQQKAQAKQQQLKAAANVAGQYDEYIAEITSLHKSCSVKIDWTAKAHLKEPLPPSRLKTHEELAERKYLEFKPSFLTRILKTEQKKRNKLKVAIKDAAAKDLAIYEEQVKQYQAQHLEWQDMTKLAARILKGDFKAYLDAVKAKDVFSPIKHLGTGINLTVDSEGNLTGTLDILGDELIPKEKYVLRQSGSLSTKEMPIAEHYAIYQDYVCSASIRAANELFALLPISKIIINAQCNRVNRTTGHLEPQPIFSALLVRETMNKLDLNNIDPSEAMKNFVCEMKFKKTTGFETIMPLTFEKVAA